MNNFRQTPKMCSHKRNSIPGIFNVIVVLLACLLQVESIRIDLSPEIADRSARIMQFLSDPTTNFNHNRRVGPGPGQGPRVRPSIDNIQPPKSWRPPAPPGAGVVRREFNGNWPGNQATRYAHSKDTPVLDVGKNQFYRTKEVQPFNQYTPNFKASPHFNANIHPGYAPIPQHAIPVEANKYLGQSQSYESVPAKHNHNQFGQAPNSYAVYEEAENVAKTAASYVQNYQQTAAPQKLTKAAEDYLHFMGTNEYFLPRHEPNYRQLDVERDQLKYQYQQQKHGQKEQQQYQAVQQSQKPLQPIQPQQPQPPQHYHQAHNVVVGERKLPDTSASSSYNKPLRVADLFYQQDPAPSDLAVVRGSYQAGQNAFVVKSDGNKSVKHILSSSITAKPTPSSALNSYTQSSWHQGHKTETPEPLRFEFTEHDAIKGSASYTNAPQGQQYYYETHPSTAAPAPPRENLKPVQEVAVQAKETIEYAKKNTQDKPSLEPATVSAELAENAKDNEAYCEKICANVYDENDEIVCGSDGYMYTGESQLECYSSCLNIEVSIKSKGSCA